MESEKEMANEKQIENKPEPNPDDEVLTEAMAIVMKRYDAVQIVAGRYEGDDLSCRSTGKGPLLLRERMMESWVERMRTATRLMFEEEILSRMRKGLDVEM